MAESNLVQLAGAAAALLLTAAARAQSTFDLDWYTIDCGGGMAAGGAWELVATIGQPDAGSMSGGGGAFSLSSGFWSGGPAACYANCDGSTGQPLLNVNDFMCFLNLYSTGSPRANCDGSTVLPVLNINDFICFQTRFAAGCP